jgi:hypothetical protein
MVEGVNLRYISSTFVKAIMCPQYNNIIIKNKADGNGGNKRKLRCKMIQ